MSAPWWVCESPPEGRKARLGPGPVPGIRQPLPAPVSAREPLRELLARVPAYTPEWTGLGTADAGEALAGLFGSQLQPLLERLNRLPEKALVEFLRLAEIEPQPGSAAQALLVFSAASGAPRSVPVPAGFQVGAQPADGSEGLAVFETGRELWVAPGKIAEVHVREGRLLRQIETFDGGEAFRPFGDRPLPGRALLLGIEASAAPQTRLAIGLGVAAPPGAPPPAAAGGLQPLPLPPPPVLRWEVLDGASFTPAEVTQDDTGGLIRSGVVELRLPRRWRPGRPPGLDQGETLYWAQVRIAHGEFDAPPELSMLHLNVVPASAAETIRDEVVQPEPGAERRYRLARTPVVPGTLVLDVVEGGAGGDLLALAADAPGDEAAEPLADVRRWSEISDLAAAGPNDRVYVLDEATGSLTFGDGVHGAALPQGFRHVQAASYQVGGGARGAVDADAIDTLIRSAPFVTGVTNPLPAGGGTGAEERGETLARGPQVIRARGRAVTEADYELLALEAPGADVRRAHAVSGHHPALAGAAIPGVVGVYVVPRDRGEGQPTPDEQALGAVARHLARAVAPAGVEVVAAAPRYHRIRAEVTVQLGDPAADPSEAVRRRNG